MSQEQNEKENDGKPGVDYCCGAYDSESGCCPFEKETGRSFGI